MDRLTAEHRSWNMSRIKGRDTGPERKVRSLLHRLGFRFSLRRRDLPGRPDIVLPRYEQRFSCMAVFGTAIRNARTPSYRRRDRNSGLRN